MQQRLVLLSCLFAAATTTVAADPFLRGRHLIPGNRGPAAPAMQERVLDATQRLGTLGPSKVLNCQVIKCARHVYDVIR